jgi:hypothetical protein
MNHHRPGVFPSQPTGGCRMKARKYPGWGSPQAAGLEKRANGFGRLGERLSVSVSAGRQQRFYMPAVIA